jgi:hypothetical protein
MFDGPAFKGTALLEGNSGGSGMEAVSGAGMPGNAGVSAVGNTSAGGVGGQLTRPWILFFESLEQSGIGTPSQPIIGFVINTGATGTNVGPMLPAPFDGTADVVVLVVKASDGSTPLVFDIKQNGTVIFSSPSIAAGTASGTLMTFVSLSDEPLTITYNDIFTIDISSGSSSWMFTAVLETSTASTASGNT